MILKDTNSAANLHSLVLLPDSNSKCNAKITQIFAHLKLLPYPTYSDHYSLAIKFNILSLSKFYLFSFGFNCSGKVHLQMTDSD